MKMKLVVQYVTAGLLATLAMSADAWAAITCTTDTGGPAVLTLDSIAPIVIDADLANGSVLATYDGWAVRSGANEVSCEGAPAEGILAQWAGTTGAEVDASVYATGIPGIGLRIALSQATYLPYVAMSPGHIAMASKMPLKLEIIKTGTITRPGTLDGEIAKASFPTVGDFKWASIVLGGSLEVSPLKPTCKVATAAVIANLGNVHAREFNGIGSSSTPREFDIDLDCSGGHAAGLVAVAATITDAGDPQNISDRMALTATSEATGVMIQVLKDGQVLKFGPDSSTPGTTNQWSAGQAANGLFRISLAARYLQTAETITAGTANGRATFTISYP